MLFKNPYYLYKKALLNNPVLHSFAKYQRVVTPETVWGRLFHNPRATMENAWLHTQAYLQGSICRKSCFVVWKSVIIPELQPFSWRLATLFKGGRKHYFCSLKFMVSKGEDTYFGQKPPKYFPSFYFEILNGIFFLGCWTVARLLFPSVLASWNWQFPITWGRLKEAWCFLLYSYPCSSSLICKNMQINIFRTWKKALSPTNACNYLIRGR